MGILASTVANVGTDGRGNFKPDDFIPVFEKRMQSIEEQQAILMGASAGAESAKRQADMKTKGKKTPPGRAKK